MIHQTVIEPTLVKSSIAPLAVENQLRTCQSTQTVDPS
ncbi:hypothetical protein A2U01_0097618, partial [Trifolium medium]|nr:hypothetical protein [Trifolium medium]